MSMTMIQLDDRIDESLQYFHQCHYDGSIKMYLKHKITSQEITGMKSDETFTETAAVITITQMSSFNIKKLHSIT